MSDREIGRVTHYFGKIGVAAITITEGTLSVGDKVRIKGHTSDFTQVIDSMQVDGKPVDKAGSGDEVGIRVSEHAREHDIVFKVED